MCLASTKAGPCSFFFPHCAECVYTVDAGMVAVQWVVSMPNNCDEDEVPLHFGVNRKSPRGSWIALGLLIESCATIKVWGFFSW